jgi:hypothetical protein
MRDKWAITATLVDGVMYLHEMVHAHTQLAHTVHAHNHSSRIWRTSRMHVQPPSKDSMSSVKGGGRCVIG